MKRQLAGYAVRADEKGPVIWLASSPDKARDGMRIPVESWSTDAFEKQGSPLMWAHQYNEAPIGRVTKLSRTSAGLVAETEFTSLTQRGRETEQLVRAGFLNCCSVGFEVHEIEGDTVKRASLTELSVVPIGSDVNAVALARSAFETDTPFEDPTIIILPKEINQQSGSSESQSDRPSWDETAARMVRLFTSAVQRPERERRLEYQAMLSDYVRFGKTPPELLDADVMNALDDDTLRGLFLEGEPDLCPNTFAVMTDIRAGAVLSTRNRDDLARAIELLQGIAERATKEAETEPPPVDDTEERKQAALNRLFEKVMESKS